MFFAVRNYYPYKQCCIDCNMFYLNGNVSFKKTFCVINVCEQGGNLTWLIMCSGPVNTPKRIHFHTGSEFAHLPVCVVMPLSAWSKDSELCEYDLHAGMTTQALFNFILTFNNKFSFQ